MRILQLRRGTKAQLDGISLAAGEIVFTSDSKEVFVGDGSGKNLIGSVKVGSYANRPAAGVAGRIYFVSSGTDAGDCFLDDGSNWKKIGVTDLDDIADGSVYGKVKNTELEAGQVKQLRAVVGAVDVTGDQIKTHMDDATIHRSINDSGSSATDLWSADKIGDELALKADKVVGATANDLAKLDANGNLVDAGYKKDDTGTGTSSLWSANKIQNEITQALTGLLWKNPILTVDFIGNLAETAIEALTPEEGHSYVVTAVDDDGFLGLVAIAVGDIVEYKGGVWQVLQANSGGYPAAGTRVALSSHHVISAPYTEATDNGKIISFSGSSLTGTDTGDAVNSAAVLAQDPAHIGYWDNAQFVFEGTVPTGNWVQINGAGQVNAGTGLGKSGNTIYVNYGAGIRELPTDEIGLDLTSTGGLELTDETAGGQLKIKADSTTGATVAPLTLSANGAGMTVDNSTIEHTAGSVHVKAAGITATQLNTSVAGAGLSGGAGTALAVNAGDGVDIVADAVAVDVTDFIDTAAGLKEDASNNIQVALDSIGGLEFNAGDIRLKASVAGDGLSHAAGVLAVNAGDGVDIVADAVAVDVTDFIETTKGLTETNNNIEVNLDGAGGLEFNAGAIRLKAGVAGDGLAHSGGVLSVTAGDGVDIVADAVAVDVTDFIDTAAGLKEDVSNNIQVNLDADGGMEFNAGAIRLKAAVAGDGLTHAAGVLAVGAGDGIDIAADSVAVDVTDFIDTSYGLTEDTNNIRVNLDAAGGMEFNAGAIRLKAAVAGDGLGHAAGVLSVKTAVAGGIEISADELQIKKDVTTGATVAGVNLSGNGAGVKVDNVSIKHTAHELTVGDVDCGAFV